VRVEQKDSAPSDGQASHSQTYICISYSFTHAKHVVPSCTDHRASETQVTQLRSSDIL